MQLLNRVKSILKIFLIIFTLFLFLPRTVFASVYFSDFFDSPDYSKWEVVGNGGWTISNGMFGIRLNPGTSNAVPKNWNSLWTNYIYKVDLHGIAGTDKNILINFIDNNNFYEIHAHEDHIHFDKYVDGQNYFMSSSYPFALINGTTYHFKFIKNGHNIKVFLENKQIFDITDSNPSLEGKIGLRVGTGGDPLAEVWFDNVMVCSLDDPCEPSSPTPTPTSLPPTPTPTPPTPVVFLPGLGGSINFKEMFLGVSDPGGWRMTPGARVYNNLLKAFEGNPDFHVFYYDWRKPVLDNAQKLNTFIKNTVNPWNNKVDLIGHSLGGLVARTCVQKTTNNCYANKLITIASPHSGAVDAYPALEGGEIWRTGPIKLGYELLVHYFQRPGETRRETIQRIAPVLKDLLPNFDYLVKNGSNLPPSTLSFQNSLLPSISNISILENITYTLSGRGFDTVEQIILTDRNWIDKLLGNWPDGKPIDKQLTLEGDTSVLVKSSSFTNSPIENFTYNLNHGGIISEAAPLKKIMEILSLKLKPGIYNPLNDEENFLVFFVHSPVKISSPDVTPDSYINDELIIIPSPKNKVYTLNVEGTGNDFYSLSVGQIGTESASWQDYYGEAQTGITQNFEFDINIVNPPENPLVNNQSFYSSEFDSLLNQCKNLTNSQIANLKYKNIILSLLNLITKEKNSPEMALNYVNLLRNTIATLEKQRNLDSALANQLRKYSSKMTFYFEKKASGNPKITSKTQADNYFNSTKTMLNQMETLHNFSKTATLIFLEAKEKLSEAQNYLNLNQYYQTKILAKNIIGLLLEVKILSR